MIQSDSMASTSSSSTDAKGRVTPVQDILPQPLLPSTSSSSSRVCDVFLNHGCDVKEGLAKNIYNALNPEVTVFLDEKEIEYGDSIPAKSEDAMRSALLCIAIFSPKYAESARCLEELSFMINMKKTIVPIFYNVEISNLKWVAQGNGFYAEAFSKHQKENRYPAQKLEELKTTLSEVASRFGCELKRFNDEGSLLERIVKFVLKKVKWPLEVARYPVGLKETVDDIVNSAFKSFDREREQHVNIVGIVGMGGIGKTELSKELYNRECLHFNTHSIIFDVRVAAAENTLHKLQENLLKDLLSERFNSTIYNKAEGKEILSRSLRSLRVLIVLDDVDHVDQIDFLLPIEGILAPGSLIIVTTRDSNVLQSSNISCIYKMKGLNAFRAKQLFCSYAFMQTYPVQEFEDLVEEVVNRCEGLPLSLTVLGQGLYKKEKDFWVSQLDRLSKGILPKDIRDRLKISFDALEEEDKEMFLHTTCFCIGKEKCLAIEEWNGLGWSGLIGWETLLSKCLVELDPQNRIRMHGHLRDMGRQIAKTKPTYRLSISSDRCRREYHQSGG